jgi:hypothetical protein
VRSYRATRRAAGEWDLKTGSPAGINDPATPLPTSVTGCDHRGGGVFQAALHAPSLQQVWDMIRIQNDLDDLAGDIDRELARALPPWLPPGRPA